ncbi:hypothetical protein OQA88_2752 [Cercophora sp. LCS_1]
MASSATIKAIDSSTVHQIQSGQVIVDLSSVAKELVENSIDAGATNIEVRFKNQGLDAIEVQDNGSGISPENYDSIALKHYTSKLSTYDDLTSLQTFGFRGEALSSLTALSRFSIVTCTQKEAPRATRLEFETSGKIKSKGVVSGQKGTTVFVEELFRNLPVRRRELERNIKREWNKVVSLLNQYACVQTGIKFTVSQQPTKGKRMVMFSTKGNPTTRDNIINVFGVKTMNALIVLDLTLELKPTGGPIRKGKAVDTGSSTEVHIVGHVSRPTHGEGRQTPDRQMFYVNGRPCNLPQFTKVFNEVYRSYNASQMPFIFADIRLDTHLYDVNVSPDKRSILLHDQGQMLDNLRESLIELFETQDVTIPVGQGQAQKPAPLKKMAAGRAMTPATTPNKGLQESISDATRSPPKGTSDVEDDSAPEDEDDEEEDQGDGDERPTYLQRRSHKRLVGTKPAPITPSKPSLPAKPQTTSLLSRWVERRCEVRENSRARDRHQADEDSAPEKPEEQLPDPSSAAKETANFTAEPSDQGSPSKQATNADDDDNSPVDTTQAPVASIPPPSQPPIPRSPIRPFKRSTQELATITIGEHSVTGYIGSPTKRLRSAEPPSSSKPVPPGGVKTRAVPLPSFGGRLSQMFSASTASKNAAPGELDVTMEDAELPIESVESDSGTNEEEEESLFVNQEGDEVRQMEVDVASAPGESTPQSNQRIEEETQPDPEASSSPDSPIEAMGDEDAEEDDEYIDEEEKKVQEDKKVQEMINAAEAKATSEPTEDGERRSKTLLKGTTKRKDLTLNLVQQTSINPAALRTRIAAWKSHLPQTTAETPSDSPNSLDADDAEEKLSLKITKSDFAKMRIIGQFNLGFILAVREAPITPSSSPPTQTPTSRDDDELFIIDQHASDEKYNFERLQATTAVQSQRLVQPKSLELTAVEEEIIIEHATALERNGFIVSVDQSGDKPVGSRCQLLSLPLSRETTFSVADLEELIFLLGDNPTGSATTIPRPSKVRKMLAMRACRSSIMIGRALSTRQMEKVVRHMGEMEKPWNCPHGRPTMRHLCGLGTWEGRTWKEGGGFFDDGGEEQTEMDWAEWLQEKREETE